MEENNNNKNIMPWEAYPDIWKNQTAFFTYLRGCLRKSWNNSPVKHDYIKRHRKQIDNPNPKGKKKTVWGFECEVCHHDYVMKEGQVDHITPSGSLSEIQDIQGFAERLLIVTDDDIRLICKGCHRVITNMERYGLSYEEEVIETKVRDLRKLKVSEVHGRLVSIGIEPLKTKKDCVDAYREFLKNGEKISHHSGSEGSESE